MINIFLIAFIISLVHLGLSKRLNTYIGVLAFQGILLFGVSLIELIEINLTNLLFILLETAVFKTLVIPYFLKYIVKKNKITHEADPFLPDFISVLIITGIIIGSFLLSNAIDDLHVRKIFFVAALSALFTGLYFIISRKKIITHVMGFLIIENGVFVLSLAVGAEMPLLVNIGILLDIFASVLLLGVFVNKIGDIIRDQDADQLKNLKD